MFPALAEGDGHRTACVALTRVWPSERRLVTIGLLVLAGLLACCGLGCIGAPGQYELGLARVSLANDDYRASLAHAERAIAASSDSDICRESFWVACASEGYSVHFAAHTYRGHTLMKMRQPGLAAEAYTKAIELDTESGEALSNRAWAYLCLREHDRAVADARHAVELKPALQHYLALGWAQLHSDDIDGAVRTAVSAMSHDPCRSLLPVHVLPGPSSLLFRAMITEGEQEKQLANFEELLGEDDGVYYVGLEFLYYTGERTLDEMRRYENWPYLEVAIRGYEQKAKPEALGSK